jgi:hypothetical protein
MLLYEALGKYHISNECCLIIPKKDNKTQEGKWKHVKSNTNYTISLSRGEIYVANFILPVNGGNLPKFFFKLGLQ